MSNISSKTFSSFKYIYLIGFFALLSGVFYPLINNRGFDFLIMGIVVLFVGLAGGVLLYKTTTAETKRGIFFIVGFGLIGFSLFMIFDIAMQV